MKIFCEIFSSRKNYKRKPFALVLLPSSWLQTREFEDDLIKRLFTKVWARCREAKGIEQHLRVSIREAVITVGLKGKGRELLETEHWELSVLGLGECFERCCDLQCGNRPSHPSIWSSVCTPLWLNPPGIQGARSTSWTRIWVEKSRELMWKDKQHKRHLSILFIFISLVCKTW